MTTQEVVDKYFAAVNSGDWDSWLELFDQNVVMEEQLEGHVEGIDALRGAVEGLKRGYSRFQNNPRKILVGGEDALIIWGNRRRQRLRSTCSRKRCKSFCS